MTLSSPRIGSIGAFGLALVWTTLSFASVLTPTAAMAQTPGKGYYRAELVQPADAPRAVAGDLVWACQGTSCTANKGSSRPLRVCRDLNRKHGAIATFTTKGEALPAEELARCNA